MAGASRFQSSFEAVWTARCLAGFVDDENLVPAFASANIKILPYQIAAGRITLTSILVTEILKELECPSNGTIQTDNNTPPCEIFMYHIDLKHDKTYLKNDDILFGRTDNGDLISQEDCEKILSLPVKSYEEDRKTAYWLKLTSTTRDRLPDIWEESIKNNYIKEQEHSFNADIDLIKIKASCQKSVLEQDVELVRAEVTKIKETLANASDRLEELKIQKQVNLREKQLRKKEEGLFFEQMRIEATAEEQIEQLCATDNIEVKLSKVFRVVSC